MRQCHTELPIPRRKGDREDYLDQQVGLFHISRVTPSTLVATLFPMTIFIAVSIGPWSIKGKKKTVILFHHHDTVDPEDYGPLAPIALDSRHWFRRRALIFDQMQEEDSGQWQFGRILVT